MTAAISTEAIEREIRALEDRRCQAMLDADGDTLGQLLGDGLVYTHSSGATDDKASYIDSVTTGRLVYRKFERLNERIQLYNNNTTTTAVGSGGLSIDVTVDGAPRVANLRYLSVWVNSAAGWQLVAFQTTPVAG